MLQQLQRDLMARIAEQTGGVVAEGRDITTVVAPDARVRVLLTASEEARLRRRSAELHGDADDAAVEATRDQVVRRDQDDSTVSTFTEAAEGVVLARHLRPRLRRERRGRARRRGAAEAVTDVARRAASTPGTRAGGLGDWSRRLRRRSTAASDPVDVTGHRRRRTPP